VALAEDEPRFENSPKCQRELGSANVPPAYEMEEFCCCFCTEGFLEIRQTMSCLAGAFRTVTWETSETIKEGIASVEESG
jgi:hypothetical protein